MASAEPSSAAIVNGTLVILVVVALTILQLSIAFSSLALARWLSYFFLAAFFSAFDFLSATFFVVEGAAFAARLDFDPSKSSTVLSRDARERAPDRGDPGPPMGSTL